MLTVLIPPSIPVQPASQSVVLGSNVTLLVTADGTAPLNYQWKFNGATIPNATNLALALAKVVDSQAGLYSVTVTNAAGTVSSTNAILMVTDPPVIVAQPIDQTATLSNNVTFSVTASGTAPLLYQWQVGGANIAGATNRSLALVEVQSGQAGNYSVVVTGPGGVATSASARLEVLIPPSISAQSSGQTMILGSNATFAVTADGTQPLNYQWTFGVTNLDGATNSTLVLTNVQAAQAGAYAVVVTNFAGSVTSAAAALTILVPPAILTSPLSQTAIAGANPVFSVTTAGTPPLSFQWLFNGGALSGATNSTLTLTNVQTAQAGKYSVAVRNAASSSLSSSAILTILVPPFLITSPSAQSAIAGGVATFVVAAGGSHPLAYQWQFNSGSIPGATNAVLSVTNAHLADAGRYTVTVTNLGGSITSPSVLLSVTNPPPASLLSPLLSTQGQFQFQLEGLSGRVYVIEYSTNLLEWIPLGTITNNLSPVEFIDPSAPAMVKKFYRARDSATP
jgi:hypothetical protein